MSHSDKVEVMDFLINVLKDHEKNLDTLISRTENLLEKTQGANQFIQNPPNLKIAMKNWKDFREHAIEAELICFDLIDSLFYCNVITETRIYQYTEKTPEVTIALQEKDNNLVLSGIKIGNIEEKASLFNGQLSIGLELNVRKFVHSEKKSHHKIQYDLNLQYTKNWLSQELGVHRDFIIQGNLDS